MTNKRLFIISVLIIAAMAVVAGAFFFYQPTLAPSDTQNPPPNPNMEAIMGLPKRLVVPAISVDAPVINVGLTADGSVDVPKGPTEVAWYQLGPRPGEKGSAVITGHYGPWRTGASSVFDNLNKLKAGDKIYVKDDKGKELVFAVKETRMYDPGESPTEVFNKTDGVYLNLITCQGDWLASQKTYNQRLVVFTELIKE
ncbi:MAG: hypothetical protein A3C50_01135 [Candidatus Staskawiczbacteria bacterium RIFCSPHIGHO2_02_FULL_43_16]|uniref:Sortase n=1 Tax=Candidatus Staskawiczbacteria bacterium RIFCSPHIGHO2_01_FULL_41_41 TaxID=1802203 RepID=A0A1G2HV71_9BACT|nr:MAG: hypothetical protein A2822_04825 [Candidatus Staskawiczbacteria bacterium RIFCSPHIGHO2_01_FULL_41_41]OGZ68405.1 MAG: hypothetical protein A3C50_01135 [Candidatus Staskawiczbacteria bacterium RIFCSPHIGHO2_02_FULL_43_16]OGZ74177.1 MAG: hypothetical protein A3A12_00080 [Candidatus Staskawiczbacteria bacterium RIFCSPLOWO2_01_FULL_43_17b]